MCHSFTDYIINILQVIKYFLYGIDACSQISVAQTSLGQRKFVLDMGSLSH